MLEPFRYPWILLLLESQENYSDRRYEEWSLTGKGRSPCLYRYLGVK